MQELVPCLQLVAPVGMDLESQDTWFEAALKALAGIPLGLLQRGAAAAMKKADHPAKVIPAIVAEIEGDWQWRKRNRAASGLPALPAPSAEPTEACTPAEAAAICRRYGVGSFSTNRPRVDPQRPVAVGASADPERLCTTPTRADYIRLFGIDPDAPTAADQQQAA